MSNVNRHVRNRRPETIKAMLREVGIPTVTALATKLGRPRSLVSEVISGTTKSAVVASAIASLLGKTASEIWPRLYAPVPETRHPLAS